MIRNLNPFRYGKVVSTPFFTGREKEIKEITSTLFAGNNVILIGQRRLGKTSLIKQVLKEINSSNSVYLDLYSIVSQKDFINKYAEEIFKTQKIPLKKLVKKISGLIKNITPSLTFNNSGNPTWSFSISENAELDDTISEILDLPHKIINKNEKFFVVFDEFQEINKLNGENFEKQLRSVIQNHDNISYVFLGSKSHLLLEMFSSKIRALYQSAKLINLKKIEADKMKKFIISRFESTGFRIHDSLAEHIITSSDNIPYYVQYLAAQVWQLMSLSNDTNYENIIEIAIDSILDNQNDYYFLIYENLTVYQRAVLKAILHDQVNVFSIKYHKKHNLTSQSSTQRAVNALIEKSILEKNDSNYSFSDPFFCHWLKLRNSA